MYNIDLGNIERRDVDSGRCLEQQGTDIFLKAPARRGRGFGIGESGIDDVAFSEGEMGLQGQRYDDDGDE